MASTVSRSGRTHVDVVMDPDTGAVKVDVFRDGRRAHRFELNRELEVNKED